MRTWETSISGVFAGEDFAKYDDGKTLVLMDIEGGEKELLDPGRYPALRKMDVIVEMHDLLDASISKTILARFAESHTGAFIKNRPLFPDIDRLLPSDAFVDPSDLFLLGWESRAGQTPWGVFYVTT